MTDAARGRPMPCRPADATERAVTDGVAGGVPVQPVRFLRSRRIMVAGAVGVGSSLAVPVAFAARSPAEMRPRKGDLIVHRFGDKAGEAVKPADVPRGAQLLQVLPKDPALGTVRDGSRLNGINLVRIEPGRIGADLRKLAADDIVAFSSVCTHQGCDLTQWHPDRSRFECFCHASEFDVVKMGEAVHGPAKRSLAALPLALDSSGSLIAAGAFTGRVGFKD